MNKKLLSVMCSMGFILCVFTGCTSDTTEAVMQALKLSSFIESESGGLKIKLPAGSERTERFDAYYSMMAEIISRYKEQAQTLPGIAEAQAGVILKNALSMEYIAGLKTEYNDLNARYQSLVQGFYADENYIALKNELDAKVSELASLIKGSPEYKSKLAEINQIWGEISVLAGGVNSEIAALGIMAAELSKEIQALINANADTIISLAEPAAAPSSALSNAFWQELRLLQKALSMGLTQVSEEQGANQNSLTCFSFVKHQILFVF